MARLRPNGRILAVALLIAAGATLVEGAGAFRLFGNALHDLFVRTVDLPASGDLVLVEIEPASLRRLGAWPWPRGHHAIVLQRLLDAGAVTVGFDMSFSSPSTAAQDALLADAAAAAGDRLVLPIFQQLHHRDDGSSTLVVDRPLPMLAAAARLASINVRPDPDGIIRRLATTDRIGDLAVPSMSAALLGDRFMAGTGDGHDEVFLDFGIDIRTIPRLAFADVLIGSFDPAVVAGRSVLIGATAVELGDVVAVPRWGNLPGPFVIATGFESLRLGRAIVPVEGPVFLFLLCFAAAWAPQALRAQRLSGAVVPVLLQLAGLFALAQTLYAQWALMWDPSPVVAALLVSYGFAIARVLRLQARRIAVQNREAERRIALLRSVVDTSIDAVVIADRRGLILIANPACLSVFGYEPEALIGREVTMLTDPADRIAVQLRAMTRQGGPLPALHYPIDVSGLHRDGRSLELDLSLASVGAETGAGPAVLDDRYTIHVFRDVSEQRRLEAMRRQALEARIEAERSKSEFLSTASHELRTPLNHIKGFSALLTAGVGGDLTDRQREYLGDIETAADHLTGIITDILNHAQKPSDAGARQRTTVAELVEAARRQVAALAAQRDVGIAVASTADAAVVAIDLEAVARALMHVLRNAVQFSPAKGVVTVTCEPAADQRFIRIAVSDCGPGLSEAELARVMRPFGQLEGAMSRSHGGLGVGLSTAQASIEADGGTLSLTSVKGEGTTAVVALPLAAAEQASGRAAA